MWNSLHIIDNIFKKKTINKWWSINIRDNNINYEKIHEKESRDNKNIW